MLGEQPRTSNNRLSQMESPRIQLVDLCSAKSIGTAVLTHRTIVTVARIRLS